MGFLVLFAFRNGFEGARIFLELPTAFFTPSRFAAGKPQPHARLGACQVGGKRTPPASHGLRRDLVPAGDADKGPALAREHAVGAVAPVEDGDGAHQDALVRLGRLDAQARRAEREAILRQLGPELVPV